MDVNRKKMVLLQFSRNIKLNGTHNNEWEHYGIIYT